MTYQRHRATVSRCVLLATLSLTAACSTLATDDALKIDTGSSKQDLTRVLPGSMTEQTNDRKTASTSAPGTLTNKESKSQAQQSILRTRQTGNIKNATLTELSGLSASRSTPGVLFAINDGGNSATLFAISETGDHLGSWPIAATNRDWEDMASMQINGTPYLVIGDTGNNQLIDIKSRLIFVAEPSLDTATDEILVPDFEIAFTYVDGPKNVEAFAIDNRTVLLISKEPVTPSGPAPSHLYALNIPANPLQDKPPVARKIATLPMLGDSFESRIVAAATGIDLNHPTALDLDLASNTAYLLTYRNVLEFRKARASTWAQAFSGDYERIHSHRLEQAEALAVSPGRAVWITSENQSPPLWAIPVVPPS
ncbi:MAG: hypothetical protein AB8B63_14235 [Granulosicoccus sp.]